MIIRRSTASIFSLRNTSINCLRCSSSASSSTKLLLLENIVDPIEEDAFIAVASKILARKRYEGNHWDDVIIKYKEVDFGQHLSRMDQSDPNVRIIQKALTRIKSIIPKELGREEMRFQSPHIIDLAPDGWIGPHVDSVKFSGDLIAGLSLGAERTMVMTKDRIDCEPLAPDNAKVYDGMTERYEFLLKRRSMYIMTGLWRYNYNHEISKSDNPELQSNRRISIIIRNEKQSEMVTL